MMMPLPELWDLRIEPPRPTKPKRRGALLAALVAFLMPATAQAVVCAPTDRIEAGLQEKFHEQVAGAGLVNETGMVVLWLRSDGRTWTLTLRKADGESCVLTSGSDWYRRDVKAEGPDA